MFPNKLRLPALTALQCAHTVPWEAGDLDRLVSSCSALQTLSLWCSPGLQLTALLQLTVLRQLGAAGVTEDSTVASLVQLSALQGLQELFVMDPCSFAIDDAVKPLTALTQLTRLGLSNSNGIFSITMQQQLRQRFYQELVDGPGVTCYIIKHSGYFWIWCAVQQGSDGICFHTPLQCMRMRLRWPIRALPNHKPTASVAASLSSITHTLLSPSHVTLPHRSATQPPQYHHINTLHHTCTPPQAPAGAPPDVWSQLLSCCEGCTAQATQQQEAAHDAAADQQQQEEALAAPP